MTNGTMTCVLLGALALGCSLPTPGDVGAGRASLHLTVGENMEVSVDPTNPDSLDDAYQTEQSMVRTVLPSGDRALVVAYHDTTGQRSGGVWNTPRSIAGWAFKPDSTLGHPAEGDWLPQPQIFGPGIEVVRGDPRLITDATHTIVHYVAIGESVDMPSPDSILWARSEDGGQTFQPFVSYQPGGSVDKPSVASTSDGGTLHIAYVDTTTDHEFHVLRVVRAPGGSWLTPVDTYVPSMSDPSLQNPIINVDPLDDKVLLIAAQFNDRIVFGGSWDGGLNFSYWSDAVPSLTPTSRPEGNVGPIRNIARMDFTIDPTTRHCLITWVQANHIWVVGSADGFTWNLPSAMVISDTVDGLKFQPSIRASENRVAVTFYAQPTPFSSDTEVYVVTSDGHGLAGTWSGADELTQPSDEGPVPFVPCEATSASPGFFGDYTGLAPLAIPGDEEGGVLTFYAVWADSRRGCVDQTSDPFRPIHQHTTGTWFE